LTPDEISEKFPEYATQYAEVKSKFLAVCDEIQSIFDELRRDIGEDRWSDPREQKKIAATINAQPAQWISILFFMKKNNFRNIKAVFEGDEKEALLKEVIFFPAKFRGREEAKNHEGKNKNKTILATK
jgi:hypothetical protein